MKSEAPKDSPSAPGPPDAEASPAVFDRRALLERTLQDGDLALAMIEGLLGELPHQIDTLRLEVQSRRAQSVAQLAHKIRGACLAVCAPAMVTIATEIEALAPLAQWPAMTGLLSRLEHESTRLMAALARELKPGPDSALMP